MPDNDWTPEMLERLRRMVHEVSSCPTCGRTIMPDESIDDHLEKAHPEDGRAR